MMRVGLYIGDSEPTDGGGFTFVENLLRVLRPHAAAGRHELVVCHLGQAGAQAISEGFAHLDLGAARASVLLPRERLPHLGARIWNRLSPPSPSLHWHTRVYRANAIDFVVPLSPWSGTSMEVPFGAFVWDVQHRNNPWFPEVSQLGTWDARESLTAATCGRATFIFTGTARGAEEIGFFYRVPQERIRVLPFPVPEFAAQAAVSAANPELLKAFNLPARFVLYPAQFWAHKNHVTLLHACKRLRDQRPDAPGVVFVGADKGNLAYVREHARSLGLEDDVRFLGFVGQAVLVELYRAAVALAFPTSCGPDNLPPLEAFALGCPVVASSVPGAQEQLGDAALLFSPFDDAHLAVHIASVMDDPSVRTRLVGRGRGRAAKLRGDEYAAGFIQAIDDFAPVRRAWKH
jgi:glycosyltransferase involved in cell wall biosynthesis